jgi:photosystem II stability/assembly factor-like uncharacterized protein
VIGGSVFLKEERQALILQSNGDNLTGVLIPKVMDVDDVTFTSPTSGWRLYAGSLYKTIDAGTCWQQVFKHKNIRSLYFADPQNGWLVGDSGLIFHTRNSGMSWHQQDSATTFDLNKVTFIDNLTGWALGKKAYGEYPPQWKTTLIATRNGGKTWQRLSGKTMPSVYSFSFVNASDGWIIDLNNNILRTSDGGNTWNLKRVSEGETWTSIFFINDREGWVVGDGIFYTNDGGTSWKRQLPSGDPKQPLVEAVLFTDREHGWALRTQQLLYTNDGGLSWNPVFQDRGMVVQN